MNRSKNSRTQDPQARARDEQTKFIKDSVAKVEKSLETLCGQMGAVNRRNARLRDKFDEMAKSLIDHANTEAGPMKTSLSQFAEHLSAIQDYREALIKRMDGKVIQPLSAYKVSCKHTQTDLNATMKSRGREMKTHRQLDQLRNKAPSDTRQISRAETELQRATIDVERSTKSLEDTIDKFETQRVADIKKILTEFTQIEMLFHAKALERLTLCYQDLQNLNLDDHLVLFRNSLRPSQVQQRLEMIHQQQLAAPQQQGFPGGDIYAIPHANRQGTTPSSVLQSTAGPAGQGQQHYDQEEYDDEDDYSDEEENGEGESEYETEEDDEDEDDVGPPQQQQQSQQQRLRPW